MDPIKYINVKEDILSDNRDYAEEARELLREKGVFMLNLMSSPGAGKTSLVLQTLRSLKDDYRIAVIEGDIESQVDAEKIAGEGVQTVQLRTGGPCHLDAPMIKTALDDLELDDLDMVIIENVGNLVCPAEFDTGAAAKAMILSVPEGDDKVLKYPLMFSVSDALVINKIDYLQVADFDMEKFVEHVRKLNAEVDIFKVSCKTGEGLENWAEWLKKQLQNFINK